MNNNRLHLLFRSSVPPGLDGAGSTEDVTVVRGNLASLLCIADGTPTPTVSWLKEGVTLTPDPHLKLLNLNTTVQIIQAQVNDTGRYTCVANNTAGQASRHFNLKVLGESKQIITFFYPASAFDSWLRKYILFVLFVRPSKHQWLWCTSRSICCGE